MFKNKFFYFFIINSLWYHIYAMDCCREVLQQAEVRAQTLYLVHATNILLKDSIAVAGACNRHPKTLETFLISRERTIEPRQTLHHTAGGVVPANYMALIKNNIYSQNNDGCSQFLYAYLDDFSIFDKKEEIFGGTLTDVFTTTHTYGDTSIIIIPDNKQNEFWEKNINFNGKVELYNSNKILLHKKVQEVLNQKGALINENISSSSFEKIISKRKLYSGIHANSPFMKVEKALSPFCTIFEVLECWPEDREKLLIYSIPDQLFNFYINNVEEAFKKVEVFFKDKQNFKKWYDRCQSFIKLHALEYKLHQSKKSLFFNPDKLSTYVKKNMDLSTNDLIADEFENINEDKLKELYKIEFWEDFQDQLYFKHFLYSFGIS